MLEFYLGSYNNESSDTLLNMSNIYQLPSQINALLKNICFFLQGLECVSREGQECVSREGLECVSSVFREGPTNSTYSHSIPNSEYIQKV